MITVIKKCLLLGFIALNVLSSTVYAHTIKLSETDWRAAGVLPFFVDENGVQKVILGREKGGPDKGTYDDFGGKKDKYDKHPVFSAAREFHEEAILKETIGFNMHSTCNYIDLKTDNTKYIIVYFFPHTDHCGVTYITDFSPYAQQFFDNFYTALENATERKYREKDRIATIDWNTLQNVIAQSHKGTSVTITAQVIDPKENNIEEKDITLRPIFVSKLRLFFQRRPYKQGTHDNIRLYSQDYAELVCDTCEVL